MVLLRQVGVAVPPLRRVQGLGTPDPEAVEAGGQGLRVETPQGASGKKTVEGGGHRGCLRVPRGGAGRVLVGSGCEGAQGDGEELEGEEGGPGPP